MVSGAKARYRGSGMVNGAGNYGFELTAIDGQVNGGGGTDKFRIKIWDKNQGNGIIYDNQMNAPDGADPTTVRGGGSIVIHKESPLRATTLPASGPAWIAKQPDTLTPGASEVSPNYQMSSHIPNSLSIQDTVIDHSTNEQANGVETQGEKEGFWWRI